MDAEELDQQRDLLALERRACSRFRMRLTGVCTVADGEDVVCVASDLSIGGFVLQCGAPAEPRAVVVASLPQVGLLRGRVAYAFEGGFGVVLDTVRPQRQRVAAYLAWLLDREAEPRLEDRAHVRIVPLRRLVPLAAAGGSSIAHIIDLSRSGVALETGNEVVAGDRVVIGGTPATAVRVFAGGFAAQFETPLGRDFDSYTVL